MRKALGLSAVLGIFALGMLLVPSPEATAATCFRCPDLLGYTTTPGQWGMGSSCAAAEADAISNAQSYAQAQCIHGVCDLGASAIVTPCMWTGSQYKADATVEYKCWLDLCPKQPEW